MHTELRSLRQAYLSTAAPRKAHLRNVSSRQPGGGAAAADPQHPVSLTDRDRDEIDANAKMTLRDLNARIRALEDAEQLRQNTETALLARRFSRGLGALGAWAAGGGGIGLAKTREHLVAEAAARQVGAHRESVIWYLRTRLQETARTQQRMMETRLTREMEKNRSVLAKARTPATALAHGNGTVIPPGSHSNKFDGGGGVGVGSGLLPPEESERRRRPLGDDDLTEDQKQMFEKGNQDMLKHYESTLDKVRYVLNQPPSPPLPPLFRQKEKKNYKFFFWANHIYETCRTAEKSLIEIAELQNLLVGNLTTQSAHIDQLVAESFETTEGIGKGNKELKKSTQRSSPARYTFFAAAGLCTVLVLWDLVI